MTDTRHRYEQVAEVFGPIALGVIAAVWLLVIVFALHYRTNGKTARRFDRRKGLFIEAGVVVCLATIAVFLIQLTFRVEGREDRAQKTRLQINIVSAAWRWSFGYTRDGRTLFTEKGALPTLVVPTSQSIHFTLTSKDVVHAFWIPARRFKKDAIPGNTTDFNLFFPRAGTYSEVGECSEFCGFGHVEMRFKVTAMPSLRFERWLQARLGGKGAKS